MSEKNGLLLVNLGSPERPKAFSVARYLRTFLMDPYVVDIPYPLRWILVHGLIVPFRSSSSGKAYQSIWQNEGSPLRINTQKLAHKVQQFSDSDWEVDWAMRYGSPSISQALESLRQKGVSNLTVIPLYPQYALSSTESTVQELKKEVQKRGDFNRVRVLNDFYDEAGYVKAVSQRIDKALQDFEPDFLLLSYHGLPVRHLHKAVGSEGVCRQENEGCCEKVTRENASCYRAQCLATSRAVIKQLTLQPPDWKMTFQSRLGRAEWISPYTDKVLEELGVKGVKKLLVACPSFTSDCLETLEEIEIRGRESFQAAGGEDLKLVPCVNDSDLWAQALAQYPLDNARNWRVLDP